MEVTRISKSTPVYLCDPGKARTCDRHNCWAHIDPNRRGTCRYTTDPSQAVCNESGPVRTIAGELQEGDRIQYDPLALVDETKLSELDRVGLAYCRLNCWQWDTMFGPEPPGFYYLPNHQGPGMTKFDLITPIMRELRTHYPESLFSRSWWVFFMGKTEEEWINWYTKAALSQRMDQSNDRDDCRHEERNARPGNSIFRRFLALLKSG